MATTTLIEVTGKPGSKDPLGLEIAEQLKHFGHRSACKVATSKLYRLIGPLKPEERTRVGTELLSDPVVEESHEGGWNPQEPKGAKAHSIVVDVWYKQGVTDAVGESVLKGLRDMNLDAIEDVRTGMRYRFIGLKNAKVAEKLALAVLLNPLIHDRVIHAD